MWGTKIHTHTKQQANLQFCISGSIYFWIANWKTKYSPPSSSKGPKLQVSPFTLLTLCSLLHPVYSPTNTLRHAMYTRVNKNPSAWNILSPKPEVTCGTVAIIIRVVLLSPYLRIRAVSLSSIHYNQSHRICINRRRQYICLIWN